MGQKKKKEQKKKKKKNQEISDKTEIVKFKKMLAELGLEIEEVVGDGNCLFRSFASQHCGDFERHEEYRQTACDYLSSHSQDFTNFQINAEEQSFDDYVEEMRKDACWGSHLELTALCLAYNVSAIVFQPDGVHLELGMAEPSQETVLLSFHDQEHFNSVRFRKNGDELLTLAEARKRLTVFDPKSSKDDAILPPQTLVRI